VLRLQATSTNNQNEKGREEMRDLEKLRKALRIFKEKTNRPYRVIRDQTGLSIPTIRKWIGHDEISGIKNETYEKIHELVKDYFDFGEVEKTKCFVDFEKYHELSVRYDLLFEKFLKLDEINKMLTEQILKGR